MSYDPKDKAVELVAVVMDELGLITPDSKLSLCLKFQAALTSAADAGEERALSQPYIAAKIAEAREEGRREGKKEYDTNRYNEGWRDAIAASKCHDPALCHDCAALKAQGAEALRVKVLAEARTDFSQDDYDTLLRFKSLAPPAPKVPPVEAWFVEFYKENAPPCQIQTFWAAYLKHAPRPDAAKLAEAALETVLAKGYVLSPGELQKARDAIEKELTHAAS